MTRWFDLFGRRPSRRDFLRVSGDVAACIALAGLPASGLPSRGRGDDLFVSGVASGDPAPDSVILRVHADVSMFIGGLRALLLQTK